MGVICKISVKQDVVDENPSLGWPVLGLSKFEPLVFGESHYLARLLGKKEFRQIKRKLGDALGIPSRKIMLGRPSCSQNGSTNSKEIGKGYIAKIPVIYEDRILTYLWHKAHLSGINGIMKGEMGLDSNWYGSSKATIVQDHLAKVGFEYMPLVLTTNPMAGNLSLHLPGDTLEKKLTSMSTDERRDVFTQVVERMYLADELVGKSFKKKLKEKSYGKIKVFFDGLKVTLDFWGIGEKLGLESAKTLNNVLDLGNEDDFCHGDFTPYNLILNNELGVCFLDWDNSHIGDLYFSLYDFQKDMNLDDDPASIELMERETKHPDELSLRKARVKGYLHWAGKMKGYMDSLDNPFSGHPNTRTKIAKHLSNMHVYYLLAAAEELRDDDELKEAGEIVNTYLEARGTPFNLQQLERLDCAYGHNFTRENIVQKMFAMRTKIPSTTIVDHVGFADSYKTNRIVHFMLKEII